MSNWISPNMYLEQSDMEKNASIVYDFFKRMRWSDNAIAALLGNMQGESTINPGLWQDLDPYNPNGGYGLVQWTPYTKYSTWAGPGWERNGDKQLRRIRYEFQTGIEWIPTATFPGSWEEWSKSTGDPGVLAYEFMYNYERPYTLDHPERKIYAKSWFKWIKEGRPIPPGPGGKIPVWMYYKFNVRRI